MKLTSFLPPRASGRDDEPDRPPTKQPHPATNKAAPPDYCMLGWESDSMRYLSDVSSTDRGFERVRYSTPGLDVRIVCNGRQMGDACRTTGCFGVVDVPYNVKRNGIRCGTCRKRIDETARVARARFVRGVPKRPTKLDAQRCADYARLGALADAVFTQPELVELMLVGKVGISTYVVASEINRTFHQVCRTSLPLLRSVGEFRLLNFPMRLRDFRGLFALTHEQADEIRRTDQYCKWQRVTNRKTCFYNGARATLLAQPGIMERIARERVAATADLVNAATGRPRTEWELWGDPSIGEQTPAKCYPSWMLDESWHDRDFELPKLSSRKRKMYEEAWRPFVAAYEALDRAHRSHDSSAAE